MLSPYFPVYGWYPFLEGLDDRVTLQIIMFGFRQFVILYLGLNVEFFSSVMVSSKLNSDSADYKYGSGLYFSSDSYFYLVLELFLFLFLLLDICMTECDSVSYKYEWPFCPASDADQQLFLLFHWVQNTLQHTCKYPLHTHSHLPTLTTLRLNTHWKRDAESENVEMHVCNIPEKKLSFLPYFLYSLPVSLQFIFMFHSL